MIDHHQKTDDYAAYSYSDTSIGSTCEMLYNFISFLGKKEDIDKTIELVFIPEFLQIRLL
jgi:phosphoesterase RecJ-like protein